MTERVRFGIPSVTIVAAVVSATAALFALIAISARFPLPIVIGARPVPLFAALALSAGLAMAAVVSPAESRHPTLTMPVPERYALLVWWIGVVLAFALLTDAAWKGWEVVAMFAAILAFVKVLYVASFIGRGRQIRAWHPFAMILGLFASVVLIGQFLARPNLPPPIQAAMTAYEGPRPGQESSSRPAPDLSAAGLRLQTSGDVDLGGLPATLFSYDDREGSRVDVYEADVGFPAPQGSVGVDDPSGWLLESFRLSLRTGPKGTDFLVVSWSTDVVDRIAGAFVAGAPL